MELAAHRHFIADDVGKDGQVAVGVEVFRFPFQDPPGDGDGLADLAQLEPTECQVVLGSGEFRLDGAGLGEAGYGVGQAAQADKLHSLGAEGFDLFPLVLTEHGQVGAQVFQDLLGLPTVIPVRFLFQVLAQVAARFPVLLLLARVHGQPEPALAKAAVHLLDQALED